MRTYTDRHGLKDLARELLNVDMNKQQQSSDWGADKITDAQLEYAASDVLYLHDIKRHLDRMLRREGRLELAETCFRFLPDPHRARSAGLGRRRTSSPIPDGSGAHRHARSTHRHPRPAAALRNRLVARPAHRRAGARASSRSSACWRQIWLANLAAASTASAGIRIDRGNLVVETPQYSGMLAATASRYRRHRPRRAARRSASPTTSR